MNLTVQSVRNAHINLAFRSFGEVKIFLFLVVEQSGAGRRENERVEEREVERMNKLICWCVCTIFSQWTTP